MTSEDARFTRQYAIRGFQARIPGYRAHDAPVNFRRLFPAKDAVMTGVSNPDKNQEQMRRQSGLLA
jgi:hypothetical protein